MQDKGYVHLSSALQSALARFTLPWWLHEGVSHARACFVWVAAWEPQKSFLPQTPTFWDSIYEACVLFHCVVLVNAPMSPPKS